MNSKAATSYKLMNEMKMVNECCCFGLKTGSTLIGILDLLKDSILVWLILDKLRDENDEDVLRYQMFLILSVVTITSSALLLIGVRWSFVQCIEVWLVSKAVVSLTVGLSSIWILSSEVSFGEDVYQGIVLLILVLSYVIGRNLLLIFFCT